MQYVGEENGVECVTRNAGNRNGKYGRRGNIAVPILTTGRKVMSRDDFFDKYQRYECETDNKSEANRVDKPRII